MNGAALIAAERTRQIEAEGWTPDHDAEHDACEIAMAAVAYAVEAIDTHNGVCWMGDEHGEEGGPVPAVAWWPWAAEFWKPSPDPIRNLVKAGALIAAEIDRLLAVTAPAGSTVTVVQS